MPAAAPVGAPPSSLLKEATQQAALPGGHQQPTPGPQQDRRPKSSEEWVEALVQQMAGASDIQDARARAAQVLHAFEQALLEGAGGQVGATRHCNLMAGMIPAPVNQLLCTSVGHRAAQVLLAIGQILLWSIRMYCSLTERAGRCVEPAGRAGF